MCYGMCQKLFTRLEQIVVRAKLRQQPIHRPLVSLKLSASENMHDIDAYCHKLLRDQQCPVAVQRLLLCAHECDAIARGSADDPRKTFSEDARSCN